MLELLQLFLTEEGFLFGIVVFSCGVGVGASVVQVNSILRRQARDAVTSVLTWGLLLAFSSSVGYYLWHATTNLVLPSLLGVMVLSSSIGLFVSLSARQRLAEVEAMRRQAVDAALQPSAMVVQAALDLQGRLRDAREHRQRN